MKTVSFIGGVSAAIVGTQLLKDIRDELNDPEKSYWDTYENYSLEYLYNTMELNEIININNTETFFKKKLKISL